MRIGRRIQYTMHTLAMSHSQSFPRPGCLTHNSADEILETLLPRAFPDILSILTFSIALSFSLLLTLTEHVILDSASSSLRQWKASIQRKKERKKEKERETVETS